MSKEDAENTLKDIWENMIEEARGEVFPDEMGVLEFMNKVNEQEDVNISRYQAHYYLEAQVIKGKMTKRLVKNTNYYRPVL